MEHHSGEFSVHTEEHLIDEGQGCLCRIDYDDIPNHDHHPRDNHHRDHRNRNRNRNRNDDIDADTDTTDDDDDDDVDIDNNNFASANVNNCNSNELLEDNSNANGGNGIEHTYSRATQFRSREKKRGAAVVARGGRREIEEGDGDRDDNLNRIDPKNYASYESYSRDGSFSRSDCSLSEASSGGGGGQGVSCDNDTFVGGGGGGGVEIEYDGITSNGKK